MKSSAPGQRLSRTHSPHFGPLLVADSPSVADEGDVEVVVLVGRELGFEHVVGGNGGDLGAD